MLKLAGAALVLAAAFWGGYAQVLRLRHRAALLGRLVDSLEQIRAELLFHAAPLGRVFRDLSRGGNGAVEGFYRAWADAVETDAAQWREEGVEPLARKWLGLLTEEEQRVFSLLAGTLGRYDLPAQKRALDEARGRLEHFREKAEADKTRLGRVYMALSLGLGVMTVLAIG